MKTTYTRDQMLPMLERVHAAIKRVDERIEKLEHDAAEALMRYRDLRDKQSWLARTFWTGDLALAAIEAHGRLNWALAERRNRRAVLETTLHMIEFALGTQADTMTLGHNELRVVGIYGQGEDYEAD